MDRREYYRGYHSGRRFNKSLNFYTLVAFGLGMLVEFLLNIIF